MRPTLRLESLHLTRLAVRASLTSLTLAACGPLLDIPWQTGDASELPEAASSSTSAGPLAPGEVGVTAADYLIRRWPELDQTPADCTGPENCFSMNFATAPAGPAPKFWEYTYGVPLYGIQKL